MLAIQIIAALIIFPAIIGMGVRILSQSMEIRALKNQISSDELKALRDGDQARAQLVSYAKLT